MPYGPFQKCDQQVDLIYIGLYSLSKFFFFFLENPWNFTFLVAVLFLTVKINNQNTTVEIHSAFPVV